MSLRTRLFLVVGCLVVLVVGAQWWWMGRLADELGREVDEVAFNVGQSVAKILVAQVPEGEMSFVHCVDGDCRSSSDEAAGLRWLELDEESAEASADGVPSVLLRRPPGEGSELVSRQVIHRSFFVTGDREHQRASAGHMGAEEDHERGAPGEKGEVVDVEVMTVATGEEGEPGTVGRVETKIEQHYAFHLVHRDETPFLELEGPDVLHQIRIPRQGLSDKLSRLRHRTLAGSLGILALGLVLAGLMAHRITAPLRRLAEAARRVGEGDWGARVEPGGGAEVAQAIAAFNRMSGRLAELDARARELESHRHLGEIGEIARGLAHSLRNPLNALGLTLEELAAPGAGDADDALVVGARRQIRRIDGSIRSFLALASQGGGVTVEVDLDELVRDVALEALQDAPGQVKIEVESRDGQPHILVGVEPELRAVVQALLVNAVEASPAGGAVRAWLETAEPGRVRLAIEDRGAGIPPEIRQRLFTPHLSTKSHGSGMGLFLAHRITGTRYGGHLGLEDAAGGGTRAVLELGDRRGGDDG